MDRMSATFQSPLRVAVQSLLRSRLTLRMRRWELKQKRDDASFALYKQLEGRHPTGGFTSLPAGFAALPTNVTHDRIHGAFIRVGVKDVQNRVAHHLGQTR